MESRDLPGPSGAHGQSRTQRRKMRRRQLKIAAKVGGRNQKPPAIKPKENEKDPQVQVIRRQQHEEQMILQKLSQFQGPTYVLEPISREEFKFSNRSRLHVGDLPKETTEKDLQEMFSPFGEIAETFLDKEKNFAFLKVDFRRNAEKAQRELDGATRSGRKIRVSFAPNATCVKVLNLDAFVSNELLYRTFEVFGVVERAQVLVDEAGESKGEGIVEFSRKKSALAAIRFCGERFLFLTASLKPAVVEAYDLEDDFDGFGEANGKNNRLDEAFYRKREALRKEMMRAIAQLDEECENVRFDHETQMLREELHHREEEQKRMKIELDAKKCVHTLEII